MDFHHQFVNPHTWFPFLYGLTYQQWTAQTYGKGEWQNMPDQNSMMNKFLVSCFFPLETGVISLAEEGLEFSKKRASGNWTKQDDKDFWGWAFRFALVTVSLKGTTGGKTGNVFQAQLADGRVVDVPNPPRGLVLPDFRDSVEEAKGKGKGSKETNGNDNTVKAWINHDTYNQVRNKFGEKGVKKFINAMKKGLVGSDGTNGIKLLKGGIKIGNKTYTHELKLKVILEIGEYMAIMIAPANTISSIYLIQVSINEGEWK